MSERDFPNFPDKKKTNLDYNAVTNLIKEAQRIFKEQRVGQSEATWIPSPDYPDLPIALLLASDIHYGSMHVDFETLDNHLQIVEETPNFYMATNGDHMDNFNPNVFPSGMLDDPINPNIQASTFLNRMLELDRKSKVALMSQGNHDNFIEAAGYDFYQSFMGGFQAPVFDKGGVLNMITPGYNYRMIVSHIYWGRSKINITNAPKRLIEYEGEGNVDIGWIGHTHQSSYEHFSKGGKEYLAVVSGSYKVEDPWAARKGISLNRAGKAGITLMLWPQEKRMQCFKDIEVAQQHLLGMMW